MAKKLEHYRDLLHFGESRHSLFEDLAYDPEKVIELGQARLKCNLDLVERCLVLEQVFYAALETHQLNLAQRWLDDLEANVPVKGSIRTLFLQGQLFEAQGEWNEALEVYDYILTRDAVHMGSRKRIVMVYLSQGFRSTAIRELIDYVSTFLQDAEGWTMLAKLYAEESKFSQAAFCLEELLLLKPKHPFYYLQYADMLVKANNLELAVKYYCATLEVLQDYPRALMGLLSTTSTLLNTNPKLTMLSLDSIGALQKLARNRIEVAQVTPIS